MAKTLSICTFLFILLSYQAQAEYDTNMKSVEKLFSSCQAKNISESNSLEEILNQKYPKDENPLEIFGVQLDQPRQGLVGLLLKLTSNSGSGEDLKAKDIFKNDEYKKCKTVMCLADNIFGKGLGGHYLHILDKYHLNLSHASNHSSKNKLDIRFRDIIPYNQKELGSVLMALQVFPDASLEGVEFGAHAKRIDRDEGNTIANATVSFFSLWGEISYSDRAITLVHEMGHVFASKISKESVDKGDQWSEFSKWEWDRNTMNKMGVYSAKRNYLLNNFVSGYARQNPVEDFAESFTAFILNPSYMKKLTPKKYDFIKKNVFGAVEYNNDSCNTKADTSLLSKNIENVSNTELETIAKKCLESFVGTVRDRRMLEYHRCLAAKLLAKSEDFELMDFNFYLNPGCDTNLGTQRSLSPISGFNSGFSNIMVLFDKELDKDMLPITYTPAVLSSAFKDTVFYSLVTKKIIDKVLPVSLINKDCKSETFASALSSNKAYGMFGTSKELRLLAPNLCRWSKSMIKMKKQAGDLKNTYNNMKGIFLQRAL